MNVFLYSSETCRRCWTSQAEEEQEEGGELGGPARCWFEYGQEKEAREEVNGFWLTKNAGDFEPLHGKTHHVGYAIDSYLPSRNGC